MLREIVESELNRWKKFGRTIQQALNSAKIKVEEIRVINNKSIEILNKDVKVLTKIKDEILPNLINSKMKIDISYTGSDNKSGIPILSIYEQ